MRTPEELEKIIAMMKANNIRELTDGKTHIVREPAPRAPVRDVPVVGTLPVGLEEFANV